MFERSPKDINAASWTLVFVCIFIIMNGAYSHINLKFKPEGFTWITEILITKGVEHLNNSLITHDRPSRDSAVPKYAILHSLLYLLEYEDVYWSNVSTTLSKITQSYSKICPLPTPSKIDCKVVDVAIMYSMPYCNFGHMVHDGICCLSFIPEFVMQQECYTSYPCWGGHIIQNWANILQWNNLKFFHAHENIFARKLYVVAPFQGVHCVTIGGIHNLRNRLRNLYKLDEINPDRYVIINRNNRRFLKNFVELSNEIKKNVSLEAGRKWENFTFSNESNLQIMIKEWSTYKVVVTVCGSMLYNSLFMKSGTGVCLALNDKLDEPNMQLFITSEIFMAGIMHLYHDHDSEDGFNCNISQMVRHTKQVVDAVHNGKWVHTDGLRQYFNLEDIMKKPKEHIEPIFLDLTIEKHI